MTKTHIFCDDNGSSWIVKSLVVSTSGLVTLIVDIFYVLDSFCVSDLFYVSDSFYVMDLCYLSDL